MVVKGGQVLVKNDARAYIYALRDSKGVRYVGRAENPEAELKGFLSRKALREHTRRNSWLISLLKRDETPGLEILEEISVEDQEAEQRWVREMYSQGQPLIGGTDNLETGEKAEPPPPTRPKRGRGTTGYEPWRGEAAPMAKLNRHEVAAMRSRLVAGETLDVLSEEYGVSRPAAWMAVTGRTWAHLPGAAKYDKSTRRWLTIRPEKE